MLENLQWFCAVLLVIGGAVVIGGIIYLAIDVLTGGLKRTVRRHRNKMPRRIARYR